MTHHIVETIVPPGTGTPQEEFYRQLTRANVVKRWRVVHDIEEHPTTMPEPTTLTDEQHPLAPYDRRTHAPSPQTLRDICEHHLLRPPSVEDAGQCLLAWARNDPTWARTFLDARRADRERLALSMYDRLTHHDLDTAAAIVETALRAGTESPCGPRPLLLTLHDGTAHVVDFGGGSLHIFDTAPRRRVCRHWPR